MKAALLTLTREHSTQLTDVQRSVKASTPARVQQQKLLDDGALAARQWFDAVKPALEKTRFAPDTVAEFSTKFEALLLMTSRHPSRAIYLAAIAGIVGSYKKDIVHQIEIGSFSSSSSLSIAPYIEGLPVDEGAFLEEAQRCLSVDALRGCIVLGWCAAVSRIQNRIAELGYDKFNKATEEMAGKTVGRFKPYTKKFSIDSMSELQRIFDTDLLWVLEYLTLIDSNQHTRLRSCFDMRNHSAHPGLAPITGENLYSFFSDISQIILKNPKFALAP
jgi:hypothetical protein